MEVSEAAPGRWVTPVVFGTWCLALVYLLATRRYTAFIRPEFGLLLAVAHFVAMGLAIAGMVTEEPIAADSSGTLRAAVLLLPIGFLIFMPPGSLGSRAFQARFTGPSMAAGADLTGPSDAGANLDNERKSRVSESDGTDPQAFGEQTLLELLLDPRRYDGRPVVVTGMLMRDAALKAYFDGRETAVYRFLITCCAADALPLAIAVDPPCVAGLKVDQWVVVEGTLRLVENAGGRMLRIQGATAAAIAAPSQPYLF